ncbi:MAG: PQQ-binding-like beta-propeller repeat protein [Acidobacteria bacterium]|nr:PQQ-binding-like beta-propeller repeat protein [Acidobacteriota bacterium]
MMRPCGSLRVRPSARTLAAAISCLGILLPVPALADRRLKTVFRSQPVEWSLEMREDDSLPELVFTPAWTWSGFKTPLAGDPIATPVAIVVSSRDGEVAALHSTSGEVAWRTSMDSHLTVGPASDGTLVFQATAAGRLTALKGSDGLPAWSADLGSGPAVPVRVFGRRVLVGTLDGTLLSIDAESGRIEARQALPGRPATAPEPAPRTILIGTDHGFVLAFDEMSLKPLWRHSAGHAITSPPLFDAGRVFFAAADRTIRSLRFKSGRRCWTTRTGATSSARSITRGPYLYVLCYDNDIYVLNKRNGHQLTRVRLGHRLDADPASLGDHLLVVPFTEASVVGLALPRLQTVGRFALEVPGEWFTTAPLWIDDRVALGYGRDEGRILALTVAEKKEASPAAPGGATVPGP